MASRLVSSIVLLVCVLEIWMDLSSDTVTEMHLVDWLEISREHSLDVQWEQLLDGMLDRLLGYWKEHLLDQKKAAL